MDVNREEQIVLIRNCKFEIAPPPLPPPPPRVTKV